MLRQRHVKESDYSAKSAGGRLHLNKHTPLTQRSRSGLTVLLSRHSVGTYPEMSSHATCQGTLGHSRLSSLNHCGLILARRVNKCTRPCLHFLQNAQAGNELSTLSQNPHTPGKKPPPRRTEFRKVSFLALARACPAVLSPAPDLKKENL